MTGLRDGQVVGARTSDGRVVVPPPEYDPVTHQQTDDFVEVSPAGTVTSWTWVPEPVAGQPFDRPFAFALVTRVVTPVELDYLYAASPEESAFFRGLEQGRILGQRCPACHKVYVPPRSACPVD